MLDEIIDYVKFLQLQVQLLSTRRLGGATSVAPLVGADISSGNEHEKGGAGRGSGGDGLTVTEQRVAKLIGEDMGSAMKYLQGKSLCLMPISVVSAISSVTAASSFLLPLSSSSSASHGHLHSLPNAGFGAGDAPSSPAVSALLAHFAIGSVSAAAKENVVVSKA